MRLRRNQLCPLHRSLSCRGGEVVPKEKRQRQMGVRRIEDPLHPRGIPGTPLQRRNAEASRSEDCHTEGHMRPL
jgi:H2-forming N5,N10-methylenetetrahydromethanopterin dehydrogenase-like enzyme